MAGKTNTKRKDSNRIVLKKGESQRENGTYCYRWTDLSGKRRAIYAKTLPELRDKEISIEKDLLDGIKYADAQMVLNELFQKWQVLKTHIRENTMKNYITQYNCHIKPRLGNIPVANLQVSTILAFYIDLEASSEVAGSTIALVHRLLKQILDVALNDNYIRANPALAAFQQFNKTHNTKQEKKSALTQAQQTSFLNYVATSSKYRRWYPLFTVLFGTGLRIGEVLGLRWEDLDFTNNLINVNHTLLYYKTEEGLYHVHPTKTAHSTRVVPMSTMVKTAFIMEKWNQESKNRSCSLTIDGYTNFVFVNYRGYPLYTYLVNQAIKNIVNTYNASILQTPEAMLPHFSCHSCRHSFATRMFESGTEAKVVQELLGHSSINMTLDIYTDVSVEIKQDEISTIDKFLYCI